MQGQYQVAVVPGGKTLDFQDAASLSTDDAFVLKIQGLACLSGPSKRNALLGHSILETKASCFHFARGLE